MKRKILLVAISVVTTLILGTAAILWIGENPFYVFKVLLLSAFGSPENFSYTLFYATPLLFTGIAVAVALEAGLFNIGAEGQLYCGALSAITWGILARSWLTAETPTLAIVLTLIGGVFASFLGGALWGGLAGFLRASYQVHEVLVTIMLNFVAMAICNWAILYPLKNPETQSLETLWIPSTVQIPKMWIHSTWDLLFALILVFVVLFCLKKTWGGFYIRTIGKNPTVGRLAGISYEKTTIISMALSGGIAGLVGFHEVFLNSYRLIDAFSAGFGFTGLAIALIARGKFFTILFAALLFGALHKGTLDLDIETEKITRDFSMVIQALILAVLAAQPAFLKLVRKEVSP